MYLYFLQTLWVVIDECFCFFAVTRLFLSLLLSISTLRKSKWLVVFASMSHCVLFLVRTIPLYSVSHYITCDCLTACGCFSSSIMPSFFAEWKLDMDELRACFSDKTKLFLLNTPQNPTGKIFSKSELEQIASILRDYPNVVAISDEVYEHMIYYNREFTRLATLPDMWERTITVSSSGKTFSCTGWKVGWAVGPSHLIAGVVLANQWVQFSVSTPAQQAISYALDQAENEYEGHPSFYSWLLDSYERKKNILINGLKNAGLNPIVPEGGFFIIADTSNIEVPDKYLKESTPAAPVMTRDWAFCRFLTSEVKVAAIPPSAFYEEKDKHIAANYARFAFCKEDESLHEASKNLLKLREFVKDKSKLPKLE